MLLLVQARGASSVQNEKFTIGKNYFVLNGVIHDNAGTAHEIDDCFSIMKSAEHYFHVYSIDEVNKIHYEHAKRTEYDPKCTDVLYSILYHEVLHSMCGIKYQ